MRDTTFERDAGERSRTIRYQVPGTDKRALFARSGIEQLRALAAGDAPPPPISSHIGLEIVAVDDGDVVMTAVPDESHYNPIGSVHGGFFATVLDSACGCAVHTTLPAGVGYTSLEIKVSFLRPITADTGRVTAHGWVTRRGRGVAFADADIRDEEGRVLATASSTCLIVDPRPAV
ncbi:PaaI family thioesterase [Microbacterium sp. No. 7]|uniref:PaaI family thioesterase n=1 Tax=Microbacterium sp. No. 7 TaxID=1714373 RepID=UPI0006CFD950|nr:PaaI family thioesterase [Microbacterium sp. No. 7]ALJ19783.1 aromatic compound degradation protein PaaI [Microbacterium sp. No. 7]